MGRVKLYSKITEFDVQLFQAGKHFRLYEKFGAFEAELDGEKGVAFAVWAPHARGVSVIGNFNSWNPTTHPLSARWDQSGIWEGFIPKLEKGTVYKYDIITPDGFHLQKSDPFGRRCETPPQTASTVWDTWHEWQDADWMKKRLEKAGKPQPWSVYEVHPGSWKKISEDGNRSLTFRELADQLVPYVVEMGFTHVELMPIMEHPYFPSWGYQITGFFAPTNRGGSPQDLMYLIDQFHRAGIGVILDWVPSHFPGDIHGLYLFDGTHLYEYADPRRGYHPDWNSYVFDYGRNEVRSFLISNALFWLEYYHIDGLRVDAVASMLFHDYSRKEGEWIPNIYGGRENLEAIGFLRDFNEAVYANYPGVETIAEESTAYPGVSKPIWEGGLGFGQKWMMGWMHDILNYMKREPRYRPWHQNELTFSLAYAFSERFMLPLSHDEVVHMKASLVYKMPGDEAQKFANLRLLLGLQWAHPGTHLLFMGGEFGQTSEWSHDRGVLWELLKYPVHKGVQDFVRDLNHLYAQKQAFWHHAFSPEGFEWISGDDTSNCVISFLRKGAEGDKTLLVVCHFNTGVLNDYRLGVPYGGTWMEILSSDSAAYGGNGTANGAIKAQKTASHGKPWSVLLTLPALGMFILEGEAPAKKAPAKTVKARASKK